MVSASLIIFFFCFHNYQVTQQARISLTLSLSLAIRPYHSSFPAGLLDYILFALEIID